MSAEPRQVPNADQTASDPVPTDNPSAEAPPSETDRATATGGSATERAYRQTLPEILALSKAQVLCLNLDVPRCVSAALGCLDKIRALRPRIAALPETDLETVDGLERYALALAHLHAEVLVSQQEQNLPALYKEARWMRDLLRQEASALAHRKHLKSYAPKPRRGSRGHHGVGFELLTLVEFLRQEPAYLKAAPSSRAADLEKALHLAHQLLEAAGKKAKRTAEPERKRLHAERDRAFTLFVKAYEETRRAVGYLLWEESLGRAVLPALYALRYKKGRTKRR